jgi:hypothetical protein
MDDLSTHQVMAANGFRFLAYQPNLIMTEEE